MASSDDWQMNPWHSNCFAMLGDFITTAKSGECKLDESRLLSATLDCNNNKSLVKRTVRFFFEAGLVKVVVLKVATKNFKFSSPQRLKQNRLVNVLWICN